MKPVKKCTLNFINLGKDKKVYLRYFATIDGIGKTADFPCNVVLSREDVVKLNHASLDGIVQKECYKLKEQVFQAVNFLALKNNQYPTPEELRNYINVTNVSNGIDFYINKYLRSLKNAKDSTKENYGFALQHFKRYFEGNLKGYKIPDLINKKIVEAYGEYYVQYRKIKQKDSSKVSTFNYKIIIFMFLNYLADELGVNRISQYLERPEQGAKYNVSEDDVQRILEYEAKTIAQKEVQNIIRVNKCVGLRLGEIMTIQKNNVSIVDGVCNIRLIEHKKTKERTIVIVDSDAVEIIKDHLHNNYNKKFPQYLFHYNNRSSFDQILKLICKKVFEEEQVNIYMNTENINDYKPCFKWQVISSHAFRRYAIQRNIVNYDIATARTLSGHSDYRTLIKHYSGYMNSEDLKNKLLKNN